MRDNDFRKRVLLKAKEHNLELTNKKIIVGLSGGVDSVGLFLYCQGLKEEYKLELLVVHINHNIRKEAINDQTFCQKLCAKYNVPFIAYEFNIPQLSKQLHISEEEAGRIKRRETFENLLKDKGYDYIFLAHHIEDRCETILHNIIRGTGIDGLCGIEYQKGFYVRPFLYETKEEIINYVNLCGHTWVEDSTNNDTVYTRNYIRKEIIPMLENINSKAVEHICSLGDKAIETRNCLDGKDDIYFIKQDIRKRIEKLGVGLKDVTSKHIDDIVALYDKEVGKEIMLPRGIVAKRNYHSVDIILNKRKETIKEKNNLDKDFDIEIIDIEKDRIDINDVYEEYTKSNSYTKYFDYDIIKCGFLIRNRRNGDYISLVKGHKTKLKDYFINEKIPKEKRDDILLLTSGSEVLWVVGYRMNLNYKISKGTKHILKVTYRKS